MSRLFRNICFVIISIIIQTTCKTAALTITTGHCYKNVTVKYQVPVTKTRLKLDSDALEYYVDYEDRLRVETVRICCIGYRTILFGLCEPICTNKCPEHSFCAEPDRCQCVRGYEESHNHHVRSINVNSGRQTQCRPICVGGCPVPHSHCVAHNECACRPGYKDISIWFTPLRCERIQCPGDQVYDISQRKCVKVELDLEQLMQRVGKKLEHGLNGLEYEEEDGSKED